MNTQFPVKLCSVTRGLHAGLLSHCGRCMYDERVRGIQKLVQNYSVPAWVGHYSGTQHVNIV